MSSSLPHNEVVDIVEITLNSFLDRRSLTEATAAPEEGVEEDVSIVNKCTEL
jgi:hypothetical protein